MRKVAIRTKKGGVGKTTLALNIGYWLTTHGKRVCLVDVDSQYNLTTSLGVSQEEVRGNILSILEGRLLSDILLEVRPNLFLVGGDKSLSSKETLFAKRLPELTLKNKLEEVDLSLWDYIIFDCPPSSSMLIDNVLCYVREVWSPLQLEYLSLEGLDQVTEEIYELNKLFSPYGVDVKIEYIIPSMVDSRIRLSAEVLKAAEERYGQVMTVGIRRNVKLSEAPSFGKTIFEYDPKGKGVLNFESLARSIV